MDTRNLERLCRKPNTLRLLLLIDGEIEYMKAYNSGIVSTGSFLAALKDLISLGLVVKDKRGDRTFLVLTEKGRRVRELLKGIADLLGRAS